MKLLAVAWVSAMLVGCAAKPPAIAVWHVQGKFDVNEARALMKPGANTLRGSAVARHKDGAVASCAGQAVNLLPATPYGLERIAALYGRGESGVNVGRQYKFEPDYPEYFALSRTGKCDAQGNFVFDRLADGQFFVTTRIVSPAGMAQSSALMHRFTVKGGETKVIVMTP